MCFPFAAAAVSGLSAVVGYMGQVEQYNAASARYEQNVVNARKAEMDTQNALTLRQAQEQDAKSQKTSQLALEGARARASANVAAAGSGITGVAIDNILFDVDQRIAQNRNVLETNYKMKAQQLQSQKDAAANEAMSRINSVPIPTEPNPAGMFLNLASAGISGYKEYSGSNSGAM